MKKIKIMKTVLLLCAVFAFSNCEEDGNIQFAIVDDFNTSVTISGLSSSSSYSLNSTTDISDLLDGVDKFVDANVESVSILLEDYSPSGGINGNLTVNVGGVPVLNQTVSLSSTTPQVIAIPKANQNILTQIKSGTMPITVSGTSTGGPLGDDNFKLKLTFKIAAVVE